MVLHVKQAVEKRADGLEAGRRVGNEENQDDDRRDAGKQVLFITDNILDQFAANHSLVTLISKHLSWGFFKNSLTFAPFADTPAIYTIYESLLSHAAYTYRSPELMFYMILELVSGTSYNAILYQQPVPLEELKPELYAAICGIFKQFRIRKKRKNAENAPSIQSHRITMTYFRICSTCGSRSQARFCHCTISTISDRT